MKIILDDKRPMPDGPYNCVRTYEECVELLSLFSRVSFLSLDYDLGSDKTGYDVLTFMKERSIEAEHINIHSDHIIGVPRMREFVQQNFPFAALTFNRM